MTLLARGDNTGDRTAVRTPFRQFVLKVHSRCNLSCDHCYVYEMADETWRSQPPVMNAETMEQTSRRIAEHVLAHRLKLVRVIFHGGEPLLAGTKFFELAASILRSAVPPTTTVELSIQTNGVLIDRAFLEVLLRHKIRVGVSLDGGPDANDRHRRYAGGRSSFDDVVRGLDRLLHPRFRTLFSGLLCTIDLRNDPIDTYESLLRFHPPQVDFLLPHGNWSRPPPGRRHTDSAPYAEWLIRVFDRWYGAKHQETGLRLFQDIMHGLLGGQNHGEMIGLAPSSVLTIETDGSLEQVDTLKAAYHSAAATGLNIFENTLDDALAHPSIVARQQGIAGLGASCRRCPVVRVCGGGAYPHRYMAGKGFLNPSVYCNDLRRLIDHVQVRMWDDLRGLSSSPC